MHCEACRRRSGHVSKAHRMNRTSRTARSKYLQESWRLGRTATERSVCVCVCVMGGRLAQSEINNSTLIHHKPVVTARPPVAQAFLSERLQSGRRLLLAMFMKRLWISIFRLALHAVSISFWSPFQIHFQHAVEVPAGKQPGDGAAPVSRESEWMESNAWLCCGGQGAELTN